MVYASGDERASGAQSGVGWYYEVGIGLPAPDLVRAYLWHVLGSIGGDPDPAISLEEVVKKMSAEQIEDAQVPMDDYRVWLYPLPVAGAQPVSIDIVASKM